MSEDVRQIPPERLGAMRQARIDGMKKIVVAGRLVVKREELVQQISTLDEEIQAAAKQARIAELSENELVRAVAKELGLDGRDDWEFDLERGVITKKGPRP